MATIKHVQLPQPAAEALLPALRQDNKSPEQPKAERRLPRYAPMPWNPMPYMDEFLRELQARERKHDYIRMVKVGLSRFAAYMAERQPTIRHPEAISRQHLLDFKIWLEEDARDENGRPLGLAYRRKIMCYVKSWCKWMEQEQHIETQPFVRIKLAQTPKQPKPLEDEEVTLLFEAHRRQAFVQSPFTWHRQEVIILLLFGWGVRIHELQALNVSQLDMRRNLVLGINKGSEVTKPLPFDDTLKASVLRYLKWRATEAAPGEEALLVDATHGTRLSLARMRSIVVELGKYAGITINPHRLRDSFGTAMINGGAEPEYVQKIFGHSNRIMTMAYVRVANQRVVQEHQKVMGPILQRLMTDSPGLPDGIDETPPGWPKQLPGPDDEEAS
jgi:site-specific recombinase XerD